MLERHLKRYAAYFRGWCQAFGEHEHIDGRESGVHWLLAENQLGLVLPKPMIKPLYREVLLHERAPALIFSAKRVEIGALRLRLDPEREHPALEAIADILRGRDEVHVYLTSHLLYGGGNRIITFSAKKPLIIIYKEIGTMPVQLL
jgi:hypothetical protein